MVLDMNSTLDAPASQICEKRLLASNKFETKIFQRI